jgi:hypothetical protein
MSTPNKKDTKETFSITKETSSITPKKYETYDIELSCVISSIYFSESGETWV